MGILIEHYGGAFPTWIAPVQVKVIPIAERHNSYGQQVTSLLVNSGIRADLDDRNERMNFKIRDAQIQKVPYMLVVGDKEVETSTLAVRSRSGEDIGALTTEEFRSRVLAEINSRI